MLSSHYHHLGLPDGADKASIKQAFRRLAGIFHPDKNPQHQQRFLIICQAYQALMSQVDAAQPATIHPLTQRNRRERQATANTRITRQGNPGNRRFECILESEYKGRHIQVNA